MIVSRLVRFGTLPTKIKRIHPTSNTNRQDVAVYIPEMYNLEVYLGFILEKIVSKCAFFCGKSLRRGFTIRQRDIYAFDGDLKFSHHRNMSIASTNKILAKSSSGGLLFVNGLSETIELTCAGRRGRSHQQHHKEL